MKHFTQKVLRVDGNNYEPVFLRVSTLNGKIYRDTLAGLIEWTIEKTNEKIQGWGNLDSYDNYYILTDSSVYFIIPSRRKMIKDLLSYENQGG